MSTFPQVNPTYTAGRIVLSLYDLTGEAVRPWAEHGYECHIFDIQHPEDSRRMAVGKLGGKSQRTKDIRSATPRGFALAVFYANEPIQNRIDRLLAKAAA